MFSQKILMCRPDFYGVEYKINPWMDLTDSSRFVNKELANKQWCALHHTIIRLGGYVEYVDPAMGHPDLVFTANAALYYNGKVVLSRFAYEERRGEEAHFLSTFKSLGYSPHIIDIPFEGAGDAFVVDNTLYFGHGWRSKPEVVPEIMQYMGLGEVVFCDLVDPHFYHLDTCFCPITLPNGDWIFLFYPGAFSKDTVKNLRHPRQNNIFPIEVSDEDAMRFACNAVCLIEDGITHVILPWGCDQTIQSLTDFQCKVHQVKMSEFLKSGGACKCLTLNLGPIDASYFVTEDNHV